MFKFNFKNEEEETTLKAKTEKIFKDIEAMLFEVMKISGLDLSDIADLDDDTVILTKRYIELINVCEDLAIAQAEKLDKLDMLDQVLQKSIETETEVKALERKIDILLKEKK